MKATICLEFRDNSEVCFDFVCGGVWSRSLATLLMVCRGALMASKANKITAYNEAGFEYCSFNK